MWRLLGGGIVAGVDVIGGLARSVFVAGAIRDFG